MSSTQDLPVSRTLPDQDATSRAIPAISIVTTMYRSAGFLPQFIAQCRAILDSRGIAQYEIIFVNDGSPDDSKVRVMDERSHDHRIKLVDLSRNFGHHRAAIAGLAHATGALVFLIDCDLEVSPDELGKLLDVMHESAADVVYGVQEQRKGGAIERIGGQVFWWLYNHLSDTEVPRNVLTERLMKRRYVDALLTLGDRNVFLAGMMYWTGFVQVGVPLVKGRRQGASTYSLRRRISLLVEAVTSFSTLPLKMTLWTGLVFMLVSGLFAIGLIAQKILYPATVLLGFTSLMVVILAIGGVIITLMGVLGIYLSRLFIQSQGRPLYIVREFNG